jgi:hypothetical protein
MGMSEEKKISANTLVFSQKPQVHIKEDMPEVFSEYHNSGAYIYWGYSLVDYVRGCVRLELQFNCYVPARYKIFVEFTRSIYMGHNWVGWRYVPSREERNI